MKKLMILFSLFLLIGSALKVQAQDRVEVLSFETALNNLDEETAGKLYNLVKNPVPTLLVDEEGQSYFLYGKEEDKVQRIVVSNANDLNTLAETSPDALNEAVILSIKWDGLTPFHISNQILNNFSLLKYIYISSDIELSKGIISSNFSDLESFFSTSENPVEIIYEELEQN